MESHRGAGVLCLHWGGLLHLAGGFGLGLLRRERLGRVGWRAHSWGRAREATGYVGWGGGPTLGGGGGGLRWYLGLGINMVLLQLLLLRLQAGRGIGWRGVAQGGLGCRATGQLGAKGAQCIQRDVRVLWLLEQRGIHRYIKKHNIHTVHMLPFWGPVQRKEHKQTIYISLHISSPVWQRLVL